MIWTFFVLDFDDTYDNENDGVGVQPLVYLIPLEKVKTVKNCAMMAHMDFHEDDTGCLCIGDYFEERLCEKEIDFKVIGTMDLTFEERKRDYIADYIPRAIV